MNLPENHRMPWVPFLYLELCCSGAAIAFFQFTPTLTHVPALWNAGEWRSVVLAIGIGGFFTFCGLLMIALVGAILVIQIKSPSRPKDG